MDKNIFNYGFKVKGQVNFRPYDLDWHFIQEEAQSFPNLITSNGFYELADVLIGEKAITHIGVGYGTTPATSGDLDLEHPIPSRIPITESSRTGAICLYSTFLGTTDCNSDNDWAEAILATGESGNNIVSRALFTNPFHKNNTRRCYIDWTLTIATG